MVCKQFWASDQLAQPPQLWCPHSWFAQLRQVPWARKDRNVMSDRQVKEYKKTAKAVVQKPWSMLRAGAYLDKWVADNQAGTYGASPNIPLLTDMVCCALRLGRLGKRIASSPGLCVVIVLET